MSISPEEAMQIRDNYSKMLLSLRAELGDLGVELELESKKERKKTEIKIEAKPSPHRTFMTNCLKEKKGMKTCNEEWKKEKERQKSG